MNKATLGRVCLNTAIFAAVLHPTKVPAAPGDLFEADGGTGIIYKFTPGGTKSLFASGLNGPAGLAFDGSGNLFVGEVNGGTISKITRTGTKTTFASNLAGPGGVAFDAAGNVEIYDRDQTVNATLTNISTRGFVDTGVNVMIGGLISSSCGVKILVRALGPTLAQFGVPNVLADPTLELHDANGALIASNDNWQDTQKAAIQASGLPPPNASESAIIIMKPTGNGTAIVRGKNNTTGNALVEVYRLPP